MLSLRRKNFLTSPRRCFWTKIPKKSPKFAKFSPWIGFFSTFIEQNQKTRKFRNFIYLELQLSQFSAKKKNLFFFIIIHSFLLTLQESRYPYLDDQRGRRSIAGMAQALYATPLSSRLPFWLKRKSLLNAARARLARVLSKKSPIKCSTCKTSAGLIKEIN